MDQSNQTRDQAGQSSRGPAADARVVNSPTFSEPHLVVVEESSESAEDQPNRVEPQEAGQSSPGPANARAVDSPTFRAPDLVVVLDIAEETESEQESSEPAVDQPNRVGPQEEAGQSSRGAADARAVDSPTFRAPHLVVVVDVVEKPQSGQESSEPAVDRPNPVGPQGEAGQSSRGAADARAVDSPTFRAPHLVVVLDIAEEPESEQESSEPAVDQPDRVGPPEEAGQSSRGAADARAVHPPTSSEPRLVVEIESDEELVAPVGARSGVRRPPEEPLRNPREGGRGRGRMGPHENRGGGVGRGRRGLDRYA